jgi:hypothetical protein
MSTAIPVDDLLASLKPLTNADLTEQKVGGTGLFDGLMNAFSAHLNVQLEKGRITGSDYATVYLGGVQACMANAIQYLTARDQAYAQALVNAAQVEATQAQAALYEAQTVEVTSKMPLELTLLTKQSLQLDASIAQSEAQVKLITQQTAESVANVSNINAQVSLLAQKRETEIAQTADTLSNGAAVAGIMASQKSLQTQQATAFQRDAEQKAAKILMDTWVTRKTVDDGVEVPTNIDTTFINTVMGKLYANAGLT